MQTVSLARNAMATRFEILLHGENVSALRAAGEAALDDVARLENQLSLYRPASEIAQLNARAACKAVRVTPELFAMLQQAQMLSAETDGAFDITVGPLVRCWGFTNDRGRLPAPEAIAAAREQVGMHHVLLDPTDSTVRFARAGVMLDLGAIGKGYAVGRAAEILRDAGVTSALIHGGTSTTYALGHPPDAPHWLLALENPPPASAIRDFPTLPAIQLRDEALSVSAVWGRSFNAGGKTFGHVLDPRTGQPTEAALLAAVVLPSATETDALSTALLTRGTAVQEPLTSLRPEARTIVVLPTASGGQLSTRGSAPIDGPEFGVGDKTTLKKPAATTTFTPRC